MPLSHTAIAALVEERRAQHERLKTLDEERADALRTIAALDQLLKGQTNQSVPKQENLTAVVWMEARTDDEPAAPGLRDRLRTILSTGAKLPRDVVNAVRQSGLTSLGKTPIDTRVYNELGRMRRDGLAVKQGDGRYALAS